MKRLALALFALAMAFWLAAFTRDEFTAWVEATRLPPLDIPTSVEVRDRDGALLRAYTVEGGQWRLAASTADVDPLFIRLLLAYEDKGFWQHHGVDPRALIRAAGQDLLAGHIVSGGSTLTMQVARLLEGSGTGHIAGKIRQIRLALALERHLSKQQILDLYLLLAPYGGNIEGIRAATLAYFGKEPRRLTPAEAALLVAIPQSPETRRPDRFPAAATGARDRVLARAVAAGVIDPATAAAARREVVPSARRDFPALAPHLADRARAAEPAAQVIDLTVKKTLQAQLEKLAAEVVRGQGDRLQVAIVAADHRSGEILASVGSAAYRNDARHGFIDMTEAIRSPGSTLKPLVYGLAFDQGLAHPETLIDDVPSDFNGYRPQNFDHQFRGAIRVREALQMSLNIPAVALTEALGPAKLLQAMDKAAMRTHLPPGQPGLAIALGGIGVTLTDMVQLYAAIARGGVALPLTWAKVGDRPRGARILSDVAAWEVGDILAGLAPPPGAPENRLAYKTGTSYGHRDAWAIGFDGAHVVGVLDGPARRRAGAGRLRGGSCSTCAVPGLRADISSAGATAPAAAGDVAGLQRRTAAALARIPFPRGRLCPGTRHAFAEFSARWRHGRASPAGTDGPRGRGHGALHLARQRRPGVQSPGPAPGCPARSLAGLRDPLGDRRPRPLSPRQRPPALTGLVPRGAPAAHGFCLASGAERANRLGTWGFHTPIPPWSICQGARGKTLLLHLHLSKYSGGECEARGGSAPLAPSPFARPRRARCAAVALRLTAVAPRHIRRAFGGVCPPDAIPYATWASRFDGRGQGRDERSLCHLWRALAERLGDPDEDRELWGGITTAEAPRANGDRPWT